MILQDFDSKTFDEPEEVVLKINIGLRPTELVTWYGHYVEKEYFLNESMSQACKCLIYSKFSLIIPQLSVGLPGQ